MNTMFKSLFGVFKSPLWSITRVLGFLILFPGFLYAAESQQFQVFLQSHDQTLSLKVADLKINQKAGHASYELVMHVAQFGDYFLSMRPFKCTTNKVSMLCHLAYPYPIERRINDRDLSALEHDLLFIRRKPTDYGIDPWHGLIYKLEKKGREYIGIAHEVDLNILAVPPETEQLPLIEAEIHEIDGESLWLPRLLIKPR